MLIFCEHNNNRINYAFRSFFKTETEENILFTSDETEFRNSNEKKINYSARNFDSVLQIIPHDLLFETGIKSREIKIEKWKESFCFFKTSGGELPFDVFAASFWLMSRYEEYLPYEPDAHTRYSGKNALLFKNQLLLRPVVDEWRNIMCRQLTIQPENTEIKKVLTIDVDNAFAFAHKSFIRNTGGSIRNFMKGDYRQIKDRRKVLAGKMKDPFDTYDFILETVKKNNTGIKFFFLLADRAKNDTNLSHEIPKFREKIKEISEKAECGIHPSYQSFLKKEKVQEEIFRLENITGKKVKISRQHFLRMKLPESYQVLLDCGITEDHTMGFADEPGYRAGTSKTFLWYDLNNEKTSNLTVFPFVMMDATLKRYLALSPEKSIRYSREVFETIKNTGGQFTLLWHNESVNDYWKWEGWKKVFEAQMSL